MATRPTIIAGAAALVAGLAAGAAGQPAGPPTPLTALAWLAGDWQGEAGPGSFSQEVWAAPAGDSMVGMWRLVVDGKVRLFELLTITQDATGPLLRLRHVGRDGVAWEAADRPLVLPLVEVDATHAVFAGAGHAAPLRISYRLVAPDTLLATVETAGGKESFTSRRASPWRGERIAAPESRRR